MPLTIGRRRAGSQLRPYPERQDIVESGDRISHGRAIALEPEPRKIVHRTVNFGDTISAIEKTKLVHHM